MTETQVTTEKKKYVATPAKQKYYRDYKRKARITNKKCVNDGSQAVVRDLLTQKLLCDKCDKERLVNKYKKKETTT